MFTLMVVDDNPVICQGIKELIDWPRYGVRFVGSCLNGMEGYQKAKKLHPDIVVADVEMPVLNGIEMASRLSRELPDIRFIFISCYEDFDYIKKAMDLHAYKYVLKPLVMEELTSAVQDLCREKSQNEKQQAAKKDLMQALKKSLPALRREFFQELLYGRLVDEDTIRSHMDYLGLSRLREKPFVAVHLLIENRGSQTPAEQEYLMNEGVRKFLTEAIFAGKDAYALEQSSERLSYVVFFQSDDVKEQLLPFIQQLTSGAGTIREKLGAGVVIGVSGGFRRAGDLAAALSQARHAVDYRFYADGSPVIQYSEVPGVTRGETCNLENLKNELKELLAEGNPLGITHFLNRYCGGSASREYLGSFAFSVFAILRIIAVENGGMNEIPSENEVEAYKKINSFSTLAELRKWLAGILKSAMHHRVARPAMSRHDRIVKDIKAQIDANYSRISNIQDVIRPLYISASYANAIFKKLTGITIFDYLVERRISEAKKLLADPYIKVYEVSERVGYRNTSYFSALFKEHTGETPREYANTAEEACRASG